MAHRHLLRGTWFAAVVDDVIIAMSLNFIAHNSHTFVPICNEFRMTQRLIRRFSRNERHYENILRHLTHVLLGHLVSTRSKKPSIHKIIFRPSEFIFRMGWLVILDVITCLGSCFSILLSAYFLFLHNFSNEQLKAKKILFIHSFKSFTPKSQITLEDWSAFFIATPTQQSLEDRWKASNTHITVTLFTHIATWLDMRTISH